MVVVSVGAGAMQYPFIQALHQRGYQIVAFGKGRNSDEAIALCSHFAPIDTSDSDSAIAWLRSLNLSISAAGSFAGGPAIDTLQAICNEFNLPTKVPEYLRVGMDKLRQQELYKRFQLSAIETWQLDAGEPLPSEIHELTDFIVKPSIGRGSAGVLKMNLAELEQAVNAQTLPAGTIIQEFKSGAEYRVLLMVQQGEIKILAPIYRNSYENTFLLGRLQYHTGHLNRLHHYFSEMIQRLKIVDAVIKADLMVSPDGIDMIEMDIGVGGGYYFKAFISELLQQDLIETYIDLIVGAPVKAIKPVHEQLCMDYIYNWHGIPITYDITAIESELNTLTGPHRILINQLRPERTGQHSSNADFLFTVIHSNAEITNTQINQHLNPLFIPVAT